MLGSVSILHGIAMVKGWKNFFSWLLDPERLNLSFMYLVTLVLNCYFCFFRQSYLMILFLSGFQVFALAWLVASAIPGGKYGMEIITRFLKSVISTVCSCCTRSLAEQASSSLPIWSKKPRVHLKMCVKKFSINICKILQKSLNLKIENPWY